MKTGFKIKIKLLFLENQLHLEAKEKKKTKQTEMNVTKGRKGENTDLQTNIYISIL